jgi:superfamily II DNA or RNA helicase
MLWKINSQVIVLRGYQEEAIAALRAAIARGHKRLILQAQTGSGKTVVASKIMQSAVEKGRKCLFLAHARQLIKQCSDKLSLYGIQHGVIMAGVDPYWSAPVQVASRDTLLARYECLGGRKKKDLPPADVVIVDECHGSMSPGYAKILDQYPDAVILGLTATPIRGDGKGLGDRYSFMVQAAKPSRLIAEGSLVPTRIIAPSQPDLKGVRVRGGDYVPEELAARM